jgi:hypothetical protein
MIQAVADDEERGALGMHYTSVPNILKVLNPLFLDDLRAQLEEAGDNKAKLLNLRKRMARIRVFDPACGSAATSWSSPTSRCARSRPRSTSGAVSASGQRDSAHQLPRHRTARLPGRDRAPGAHHRRVPVRRAVSRAEGCTGRVPALVEGELDRLRQCAAAGLAEHLPADRNRREADGDDLFGTPLDQAEIDFENEGGETYLRQSAALNPPYRRGNPPYVRLLRPLFPTSMAT